MDSSLLPRVFFSALLSTGLSVSWSADAAPPTSPSEAQIQAFNTLFLKGVEAYQAERYDEAIILWFKASKLNDDALLSFNIAKAHHKQGRLKDALEALELAVAKERTTALSPEDYTKAQSFKRQVEQELERAQAPKFTEQRWGSLGYVGLSSTVVGVGLMSVGLGYYGAQARELASEPVELTRDKYEVRLSEVQHLQTRGKIWTGIGIGVGLLGASLILWELASVEQVPLSSAQVEVGLGTLELRGRF